MGIGKEEGAVLEQVYSDGATYPIYGGITWPSAVYQASLNQTWFTWEAWTGAARVVKVRVYSHLTKTWSSAYTAGTVTLTDDDHGVPSIMRDQSGYWHIFYGAHAIHPFQHAVTTSPDDPSAWSDQPTIGTALTYPRPILIGNTTWLLIRGDNDTRYRSIASTTFVNGVGTFSAFTQLMDYGAGTRAYMGNCWARGTDIHIIAAPSPASTPSSPYDVHYFIYRTTTGAVSNIDGSTVVAAGSLPMNITTVNASFRIFTADPDTSGDVPMLCFDTAGNQHVIYNNGLTAGSSFAIWHTAYVNGSWTTPYQLGTAPTAASQIAIGSNSAGGVDAYWGQQGKNTFAYTGCDLYTARRSAAGVWGSSRSVMQDGPKAWGAPSVVLNGIDGFTLMFSEVLQDSLDANAATGTLRGYVYGPGFAPGCMQFHA